MRVKQLKKMQALQRKRNNRSEEKPSPKREGFFAVNIMFVSAFVQVSDMASPIALTPPDSLRLPPPSQKGAFNCLPL